MTTARRYRLVIFDFDGTLADSFPLFREHFTEVIAHFRLRPVAPDDVDRLRALPAREIIRELGLATWKVPLVARYMHRLMKRDANRVSLFPGVTEVLRALRSAGLTVAIVSSNTAENVRAILGAENAAHIAIYECGAALFGKAAKFRRVLKRSGIAAESTLTIGDELRDLDAAREAGISFGAVAWGYTHRHALQAGGAEEIFEQIADLQRLAVLG